MNAQAKKSDSKRRDHDSEEFAEAKKSAMEAYEKFLEAQAHLRSAAQDAGVDMRDTAAGFVEDKMDTLNAKRKEAYSEASEYINEYPLRSAGIAFLAGFVASKFIR